jgi:hypothetical protein
MTYGAYSEASPLKVVNRLAVYNLLPHDSFIAFGELLENARGRLKRPLVALWLVGN